MSDPENGTKLENVVDKTEESEEGLFSFVMDRPLTALAISLLFGAFLASRVFRPARKVSYRPEHE